MRITAFLGTLDEVDILPASIEHLRHIGVDEIVVADMGSTDGSLEYLEAAEQAGDIWLRRRMLDGPPGATRSTLLELIRSREADWVIFLDSDEFWLPSTGSLQSLRELEHADVLLVPRYNVVLGADDLRLPDPLGPGSYRELLLYAQPIPGFHDYMQRHPGTAWIRGFLEPKVMARPAAIAELLSGRHDVRLTPDRPWRRAMASDLMIAHVPFRSFGLFERRARNVAKTMARKPGTFVGTKGWQWQRWAQVSAEGRLAEEYALQQLEATELGRLRDSGEVRSAADIFTQLIPDFTSAEDYREAASRAQPWVTAAGRACEEAGINLARRLEYDRLRPSPSVLVPHAPDYTVRFYGPFFGQHATLVRELMALSVTSHDPSLGVPGYIAQGQVQDEWRYLITRRVPGIPLRQVQEPRDDQQTDRLATWMGHFIRRLHALPVPQEQRTPHSRSFRAAARERHDAILRSAVTWRGLPDHLAAQIGAWMPSIAELLESPDVECLVHGDVDAAHVFVRVEQDGLAPKGVIDLSGAMIGHPLYDLGPIWLDVLGGDIRSMWAFLRAAQLPGSQQPGFSRRALAWTLLHPATADSDWPEARHVDTLDQLAERSFGMYEGAGLQA